MEALVAAVSQGIIPAIIIAIYLIIIKIIDNKKEKTQTQINTELTKSINIISNFIISLTKNIVYNDKDKCKIAIEDSMFSSGMRLCNFVSTTIINNNVDVNKENVLANIHNIVNAEFYNVYSTLSMYVINDKKVADYLNKQWIEDVEEDMIHIIYNTELSKENKIISFSNKINIRFKSYITYIINHTIK